MKKHSQLSLFCAAAALLAFTATAGAEVIQFDNPAGAGHFDWFGGGSVGFALDVTLDASSQPGTFSDPGAYRQGNFADYSRVGSNGVDQLGRADASFLDGYEPGDDIPTVVSEWGDLGYTNFPGYSSPLLYDQPTYLGVRFDEGSGWQYGWIGVVFSSTDYTLDAFAWAYETEPGVPITVTPEPGTLALLAVGAVGLLRRR